jgi:FMN-dependent oxidoreductase (nitrilotriacetate monooxygenase family)
MSSDRQNRGTGARDGQMILGATVRTLGAWPAGWRYPGAHRDPREDPAMLRRIAAAAEDAGLQFLFFGDWLATSAEFEHTDPYLLARIEPFAAISYLAAITRRIGLIATVSSSHAEAYSTARSSASIDLLSGGRLGLSISSGSEPRSAANFGWDRVHEDADRIAASGEFIQILRGLWDSWEDEAFVADAETGRLIDSARLHPLDFAGRYRASSGPLNVLRPPQGQPPISVVGTAVSARELAARQADLSFVSPRTFQDAVESYARTKNAVAALGRDPEHFLLLTPILPVVAETRAEAQEIYDRLVALVPVETAAGVDTGLTLPANRSIRSLAGVLGVSLTGVLIDEAVPARVSARFSVLGRDLAEVVRARSGRTIGGHRPITYRHLLVAHAVASPILVGSPTDIADHLEHWFRSAAVDGFTVLSAFLGGQFEAFTSLVVPELQRRGVFPTEYAGTTLRENLGLPVPANTHLESVPTP